MRAIEALRKARATVADSHASHGTGDCLGCGPHTPEWELAVNGFLAEGGMGCWSDWHRRAASALLDGFSVQEVSAAEEALEAGR